MTTIRRKLNQAIRSACGVIAGTLLVSSLAGGIAGLFPFIAGAQAQPNAAPPIQSAPAAVILPIHGMITDVTVESLERRIEQAKTMGAKVIVLDMDTPGGLVTSSIAIADLVRELTDIKTVAWVNPNAHSGGSLVAVACDEIVMSRSSRIGDSQVIMGGPSGVGAVPKELQPKAYTPVLADFRQSAKLNGYSEALCEAFVLPEREVWWIENVETGERRFVFREEKIKLVGDGDAEAKADPVEKRLDEIIAAVKPNEDKAAEMKSPSETPATLREWRLIKTYHDPLSEAEIPLTQPIDREDTLLEMSAGEATAFGFCKAIISGEKELQARYSAASLVRLNPNWSEALAYWLTSVYVRGFLMLLIMLGIYVEFHTPGVGLPGLVALICLAIFVGAPYLTGLANVWEILVIVVGLILIAVELFVIPGFGVAGVSGVILFIFGLIATFVPEEPGRSFPFYVPTLPGTIKFLQQGLYTVVAAMCTSLIGMVMLSRYLPKMPLFRRIVPANPMPSDVLIGDEYRGSARIGDLGRSEGPLRPGGKATFDGMLVDVVTQGEYLDAGTPIEVIERRGNRVVVRAAR